MKKKILVRGPVLSRSGYGEQTRFAVRSLRAYEDVFDIFIIPTSWGKTGWVWQENEERQWIDERIKEIAADSVSYMTLHSEPLPDNEIYKRFIPSEQNYDSYLLKDENYPTFMRGIVVVEPYYDPNNGILKTLPPTYIS